MKAKAISSQRPIALVCASLVLLLAARAPACTWFGFLNDKNHAFIGRTMEWPTDLHGKISIGRRKYDFGKVKYKSASLFGTANYREFKFN